MTCPSCRHGPWSRAPGDRPSWRRVRSSLARKCTPFLLDFVCECVGRHHCWAADPLGLGLSPYKYVYPISYQYIHFTFLHGIRLGFLSSLPTAAADGSLPQQPPPAPLPPGGSAFPPGGGLPPSTSRAEAWASEQGRAGRDPAKGVASHVSSPSPASRRPPPDAGSSPLPAQSSLPSLPSMEPLASPAGAAATTAVSTGTGVPPLLVSVTGVGAAFAAAASTGTGSAPHAEAGRATVAPPRRRERQLPTWPTGRRRRHTDHRRCSSRFPARPLRRLPAPPPRRRGHQPYAPLAGPRRRSCHLPAQPPHLAWPHFHAGHHCYLCAAAHSSHAVGLLGSCVG
jgi:hypothetical protein